MNAYVSINKRICLAPLASRVVCTAIRVEGRVRGKIGRVVDKDRTDITRIKRKSNSRGDEWETFRQLLH